MRGNDAMLSTAIGLTIGAGPIGLVHSLMLAQHNIPSIILEKKQYEDWLNTPDYRTFAINQSSYDFLNRLEIWPTNYTPIRHIDVFDEQGLSKLSFQDKRHKDLGYMVHAQELKNIIIDKAHNNKLIQILYNKNIQSVTDSVNQSSVVCKDHTTYTSPFLFIADGRNSTTRSLLNLPTQSVNFHQKALVGTLAHQNPHNFRAIELFTPSGIIAFLPQQGLRSAFVLSLNNALATSLYKFGEKTIIDFCNQKFPDFCFQNLIGETFLYPLSSFMLKTNSLHRTIFIGDAGTAVHPVAGQGLNLGISDIQTLETFIMNQSFPAHLAQKFYSQRQSIRSQHYHFTNGIVQLFSNHSPLLTRIRNLGLHVVNNLTPLKMFFAKKASGIS